MTIQDYLRVLREQWLVVLLAVVLGLAGAAAAFFVRPPEYTARLTMYVSSQGGDSASAAYQGAQLSQQRVTSYVELVTSLRVSEEVAQQLQLTESPEALSKQITATSALDSVLIDVAVVDADPARAAELANTVGEVFTGLVDELERPVDPAAPQAVAVRVVQPAAPPSTPSSTGLPVTLALGLLAGLAVGVGGALARNALDTSVKSPEMLRDAAGAPNLGTIAHDAQVPKRPLTVHEDPQSPRAEAFRQLRTNLQFVDVDNPNKVLVVTSAMPSEGKTTTIVNLAIALASAGSRILLIEADLRRPKAADLLGLERTAGLTSVLSGRAAAEQVIQPWGGGMFDVLASGPLPPNPSELLASRHMEEMLRELREHYDVILIDTPPLLPVTDAAAVAPATDGAILACRFKQTTRFQVETAVQALEAVSAPLLGTVFTMVPNSGPRAYAQYNSYYRSAQPITPAAPPTPVADTPRRAPEPTNARRAPVASTGPRPVAPLNGHREPAVTNGHREPVATNGHREPVPVNGHREPAPVNGHREPAPVNGHREAAPTNGHHGPTSSNGHREPASTSGLRVVASPNGHQEQAEPNGRRAVPVAPENRGGRRAAPPNSRREPSGTNGHHAPPEFEEPYDADSAHPPLPRRNTHHRSPHPGTNGTFTRPSPTARGR
ncbi:polysaccharide biosynthesis tyrosine autokinase [Pseudonocardia kunmingensis]|uniref:non-specific protein-tyrosine kinase n=1 Tax=Pseudonocardia kunmingensis TaxID=630975 RepID=A0A543DZN1_9PSEU|nr:polysaccharide biosynthesis tyrosine autokinase [Pseudonocardia kunmingensis]TQM14796.1 non-specific protein-tyrosine kinase [Pseudonocardia kunmingensis]